jgi:hypothetical protein
MRSKLLKSYEALSRPKKNTNLKKESPGWKLNPWDRQFFFFCIKSFFFSKKSWNLKEIWLRSLWHESVCNSLFLLKLFMYAIQMIIILHMSVGVKSDLCPKFLQYLYIKKIKLYIWKSRNINGKYFFFTFFIKLLKPGL